MTGSHRATLVALVLMIALQACSDRPAPTATTQVPLDIDISALTEGWESHVLEEDRGTRYDAPWWYLSDQDLATAVAAADGKVTIGFKDPEARGGVDSRGGMLASPSAVALAKEFLRGMDLTFEIEFELIPAVATTAAPELVATIPGESTHRLHRAPASRRSIEPGHDVEYRAGQRARRLVTQHR